MVIGKKNLLTPASQLVKTKSASHVFRLYGRLWPQYHRQEKPKKNSIIRRTV